MSASLWKWKPSLSSLNWLTCIGVTTHTCRVAKSMRESAINLKFTMFTDVGQVCFWFWKFDLVNIARYCFFACSLLRIIFQNFCALVKFFQSLFKKQFLEDREHVLGLLFVQWFDYTECVYKGLSWLTFMRKFILWSLKATQYSSFYEQWDFFYNTAALMLLFWII